MVAPLLTSGALVGAGDRAARRHAVEGDGEDEAEQLVSNTRHRHRLKLPTGAFVMGTWRHRLVPPTGAYSSLFFWYRLVAPPGAYSRVLVPGGASTRYQNPSLGAPLAKGTSCCCISTGCNSSWYLWP